MKPSSFKIKYAFLFVLTLAFIGIIGFRNHLPKIIKDLFNPVLVVSQIIVDSELKSEDGRTNVLILGVDRRSSENSWVTSLLTDTIMVVSIDHDGLKPVVISIPRDLWVAETGSKINAVYPIVLADGKRKYPDDISAAQDYAVSATISAVRNVVGVPIHYYAIIGFDVFKEAIDSVGGIQVSVDEAFDDYLYPIEGKENATPESERYTHLRFNAGKQIMDGETALQYSRSRHSTNLKEQGDFARARRQQKVVVALKGAILSSKTLLNPTKIKGLYENYRKNVQTNMKFSDLLLFYKFTDSEIGDVSKIVLSDEPLSSTLPGSGVLIAPEKEGRDEKFNGQYALIPSDRSFDNIHALIRSVFFSGK